MCGIIGLIESDKEIEISVLKRMADEIKYRGPDDEGFYLNNNKSVGFGFRRLSIIDLETGHQPLSNENEKIWVILNGEIYNFDHLRKSLISKGHVFKTKSDTECIVHGYEEYGENIFSMLNGMFSIAIWDDNRQTLLLARDRAGEKPLHYYFDKKIFLFASEIKSILVHPEISKDVNWSAIDEFFSYGYISAPNSIYKNIFKLMPGDYLIFNNSKVEIKKYWKIDLSRKFEGTYEDAKSETIKLLNDSVKIRMVSDVPIGAFLSGGVDSSVIVALMANNSTVPIKTFSVGFIESDYDERKYARIVSDKYQTEHTELVLKSDLAIEKLEEIILSFDEPFGDSSAIPTYLISKLTSQYVTVSLSGDGGDELFGGYTSYSNFLAREKKLSKIPLVLRKLCQYFPLSQYYTPEIDRVIKYIGIQDRASRFILLSQCFTENEKKSLFTENILTLLNNNNSKAESIKRQHFSNEYDIANQIMYFDFKNYLNDDILVKVDRMSMLSSLESRAPLLDHRLIEFAFSLPSKWKINSSVKKIILKESVKDLLPKQILNRNKMGFGVPIKYWVANEFFNYCKGILITEENAKIFNLINVAKLLEEHKSRGKDHSSKIWLMLCFVLWKNKNLGVLTI